jgi:catechol 2,3-dioxygenase-like lactoylglutathione lyase family enzyme
MLITLSCQTMNADQESKVEGEALASLESFGLQAANVFLYYQDLDSASQFYTEILGLELVLDHGIAKILRVAERSYITLVDASAGMHSAAEPKTVAIALITDQLDEWHSYLKTIGVAMKYDLKQKEGSAHDGFVITDPEGYLLEFERFNAHEENTNFVPYLDKAKSYVGSTGDIGREMLGFKATVTWLYYHDILKVQEFYEDTLGFAFVADQGWAKILRITDSAFLGLVDESRGMHKFTDQKAVNVSFILKDLDKWHESAVQNKLFPLRSDTITTGPDNRHREFIGFDPGGYYLEFDQFIAHPLNEKLLHYLK